MDVVFVVMPFAEIGRPAIGVSLLKAGAAGAGFAATIEYCNLDLAASLGQQVYQQVSSSFPPELLVGEWFFADDLFGDDIPAEDEYVDKILAPFASSETIEALRAGRHTRDLYLSNAVRRIADLEPKVVGFTTTFHQTCASLAVARRLKQLPNPPVIVFGGANCEAEMGLQMLQSFPWIDYVCSGESDGSFLNLLHHLLSGVAADLTGVLIQGVSSTPTASPPVENMDALPFPDYDDYFEQLSRCSLSGEIDPHLVTESSRGCWWGAKHHCTFCGLNGATMAFRSKSPMRAFEEIQYLCRKHNRSKVAAVDNILDMQYIDTLFPMLASSGLKLEMFYEVKANLRFDQLVKMYRGGVRQIQPGIESLSDQVLRLMEKGVTSFQSIQLLRWCEEIGIECAWNLLAGFPGESPGEYARMAELIPFLTHLNPPCSCARLRLDRFSPFHARSEAFGFEKVRAARAYFFIFPLGRREMSRLAYFFDFDYSDDREPQEYLGPVQEAVNAWWDGRLRSSVRPRLDAEFEGDEIAISDLRPVGKAPNYRLQGLRARLFALCDAAMTIPAMLRKPDLAGRGEEVQEALDSLVAEGLMTKDDTHYLTLAVFRNRPISLSTPVSNALVSISQAAFA
jgi:ribosomal peptide maturation radical SAM protein 1